MAPEEEPRIYFNDINEAGGTDTGVSVKDVYEGYKRQDGTN